METPMPGGSTTLSPKQQMTMYLILRAHSLGELNLMEGKELKEAKTIVSARINEINDKIKSSNLFFTQIADLRADVRWYVKVDAEIDSLLATLFHAK